MSKNVRDSISNSLPKDALVLVLPAIPRAFLFMTYAEKLKDPRWQKKRLEILSRDYFMCKICGDESNTLHVHHKIYEYGKDPWDYDNSLLVTLCADCHESEGDFIKEYSKLLIDTLKKSEFIADDWREIASGVYYSRLAYPSYVVATIISLVLQNPELQELIFSTFKSKNNG